MTDAKHHRYGDRETQEDKAMTDTGRGAVEMLIASIPGAKSLQEVYDLQDKNAQVLRALLARAEKVEAELEAANADIPPTPAQIMADERVKALVEALEQAENFIRDSESKWGVALYCGVTARAALAQLKEPKP